MAQPNDLLHVVGVLAGLPTLLLPVPLGSAHAALKPGGTLEQLGVGEQKVSEADMRRLGRWRATLLGVSAFHVLAGVAGVLGGVLGIDPSHADLKMPALQNSGQGLGFKLGHTVIDRKTLTSAAVKMVTGFTTVYAVLLALGEKPGGSEGAGTAAHVCELSAAQVSMVQSVLQERNASCSFNMTVDAVLAM